MRAIKSTLLISILCLTACSHQQAFLITAQSLEAAGDQFMVVHDYMEESVKEGKINPADYTKWKTFGMKFALAFPRAVDLYKIAMLTDDLALKEQAMAIILDLMPTLLKFAGDLGVTIQELKQ